VDNDGVDDFIIIDAILNNEDRNPPSPDDLRRWAEGDLPRYGISGWSSGVHEFPVVDDSNWAIAAQWSPGSISMPFNVVIGADLVTDYIVPGFTSSKEDAIRCCIEKNLCETLPSDFVIPSTGTACNQTFDCQYTPDGTNWTSVCQN
jgi:hypothetical protein